MKKKKPWAKYCHPLSTGDITQCILHYQDYTSLLSKQLKFTLVRDFCDRKRKICTFFALSREYSCILKKIQCN